MENCKKPYKNNFKIAGYHYLMDHIAYQTNIKEYFKYINEKPQERYC